MTEAVDAGQNSLFHETFVYCLFRCDFFAILRNASGQDFENLDFEQANIVCAPSGFTPRDALNAISTAYALPYWTVREDSTICMAVWGEPNAFDETSVALVSAGAIQGNYSGSYPQL